MAELWTILFCKTIPATGLEPEVERPLVFDQNTALSGRVTGSVGGDAFTGAIEIDAGVRLSRRIHFKINSEGEERRFRGRVFSNGAGGFAWGRVRRPGRVKADDDNTWVATSGPVLEVKTPPLARNRPDRTTKTAAARKRSRKAKA